MKDQIYPDLTLLSKLHEGFNIVLTDFRHIPDIIVFSAL